MVMVGGQPEGTSEVQVSPAQAESALRESIIERVMAGDAGGDGPEAPGAATGDAANTDPASTQGDGTTPPAGTPDPDAMPTDPTEFAAWVEARDARLRADFDERMANQRRSLVGSFESEQAKAKREDLLEELDALNDEALAERLKTDPVAAKANSDRLEQQSVSVEAGARDYALQKQVPQMFAASAAIKAAGGIDLVDVFADASKAQEIAQSEHGVFGWLVTEALKAGGTQAVEKFKGSAEYKRALEDAATNAVRDAMPQLGGAPQRGTGQRAPSTTPTPPQGATPEERAVLRAQQRLGRSDFDVSELATSGRGRRAS